MKMSLRVGGGGGDEWKMVKITLLTKITLKTA